MAESGSSRDRVMPPAAHKGSSRLPWATRCALLGFLAVAGFFLVTEHRAHLFGALPYLLLLACPLLHFFMHRGHGGGGQPK